MDNIDGSMMAIDVFITELISEMLIPFLAFQIIHNICGFKYLVLDVCITICRKQATKICCMNSG